MSMDAVLIAGPTASGKSAVALAAAERFAGMIINADSMQVYSELAVLTARPSPQDQARVPHRLYGHVSSGEIYSAGRYQEEAAAALAEAKAANRLAVFVGGTGLYFNVLTKGLSPIPPVPAEIRQSVRARFEAIGREAFFAELVNRDPAAAKLRISDTQRMLRAADVLEATGRPLSVWQAVAGQPVLSGLRLARFVIAPRREVLAERIEERFETMIREGGLAEAKALVALDPEMPAAKALGIPELWRHLHGEVSLDSAIAEAKLATKRYAKRQMTWFRRYMADWEWLIDASLSNIIASIARDLS